jgi:hypothetical protein
MDRIENVTAHPGETERPLRDEELEAVNGGVNNASPMDPLINTAGRNQQAAHKTEICYVTTCVEWPF